MDDTLERRDTPIVGIGASAGGLAALQTLLGEITDAPGAAFVVVMHLSPDHESHLAELLQSHCKLVVQQVAGTVAIEADRVYVIPPGANLDVVGNQLRLSALESERLDRAPIDHLFWTLAESRDGDAIGVILSGTGTDGSLGLREIRERGGLAFVQEPHEAEHDGMPEAAIAAGAADRVLSVAEIARALVRHLKVVRAVPGISSRGGAALSLELRDSLDKILEQIRTRTGMDFGHYKTSMVLRRIRRRMHFNEVASLEAYLARLLEDPDEARRLADDMLIKVTSFFRDPGVFAALASEVIPRIFDQKHDGERIRAWSVGCATGEEAYSLAILLLEEASARAGDIAVQVFASDLDDRALEVAREGFYPATIEAAVEPEYLERYFEREKGGYRIRNEVREICVFTSHNLLGDPPFSKLDLVLCRNLLIYLRRDLHNKVAELFHYALEPAGILVLGESESLDAADLFRAVDKRRWFFERRGVPSPEPSLPVFPMTPHRPSLAGARSRGRAESLAYQEAHQTMLVQYGPATVLLSPDDKVVHVTGRAGRYLVHPPGPATAKLFKLVREELALELRAALAEVRTKDQARVRSRPITVSFDDGDAQVVLHVQRAEEATLEGLVLVIFDERETPAEAPRAVDPGTVAEREVLLAEKAQVEKRLESVIEEYETNREELKAANEELQSTNEELRSTLEELETSKEELQSTNEELKQANEENNQKLESLHQLSADLQNLLEATSIATLFLDRELRILRFTPQVAELFNVSGRDRGRLISDFTHRLGYRELAQDARRVLESLAPVEREVKDEAGRWYLTRLLPYRSLEDQIAGVVITFVDITRQIEAERKRQESEERLSAELESMETLLELVSRLLGCHKLSTALDEVLAASIDISGADMGNIQLVDRDTQTLEIAAHRGFGPEFLKHFRRVSAADDAACGRTLRTRERVIIEDVEADPAFAPHRAIAARAGYRAVQSTPLMGRSGECLGILSTHFAKPHRPSARELRLLDLYARQAADFLEYAYATDQLAAVSARKDEYLAMLGHELRNPLAAIRNVVALLSMIDSGDPKLREACAVLDRQSGHMAHLIDGLLDVSRIVRNKIILERKIVDVRQSLNEVLESRQSETAGRGLSLRRDEPVEPLWVSADPVRLVQIFDNLIGNAIKFTAPPGTIAVSVTGGDEEAIISVKDSGVGMDPEILESVFEPFYQAGQDLSRRSGGLGIGLALARGLVELHGGTIEARSEGPGAGSEFVVRLPRAPSPPAGIDDEPADEAVGWRILIVEDNQEVALTLEALLLGRGHRVDIVETGAAALDILNRKRFDVVLCDIGLPDMSGHDVARSIRQMPRNSDVVLLAASGYGQEKDRRQARQAGFDGHLTKPFDFRDLERLIGRLTTH